MQFNLILISHNRSLSVFIVQVFFFLMNVINFITMHNNRGNARAMKMCLIYLIVNDNQIILKFECTLKHFNLYVLITVIINNM